MAEGIVEEKLPLLVNAVKTTQWRLGRKETVALINIKERRTEGEHIGEGSVEWNTKDELRTF